VLKELKAAGASAPARVLVKGKKWLVPVVRGVSFASDAEAYLIAANQLSAAGGWNDSLLGQMMADLRNKSVSFDGLGFDQGKLNAMLASFAPAAEKLAAMPTPPAPVFTSPAPSAGVADEPLDATVAAVPGAAALPPAITPSAVETSDGQFSPPPTSMPILEVGQSPEDVGVLDPTARIESAHAPKVMRTVLIGRYHIPCSAEESARLDALISAWQEKTGSLYGFFTAHLSEPPADF